MFGLQWGTFSFSDADRVNLGRRPGFHGERRRSPITGRMERHYPPSKRRAKYAVSAVVTALLLVGACAVMVVSMNLQGYISKRDAELYEDSAEGRGEHPLYYPLFARLSEEGAVFDATSPWRCFLPVILRTLVVMNMNGGYSRLAETLTEWENHETVQGHRSSVILKRVLFEAFDAYIILFYLAIYERDVHLLRLELVGAFNVDVSTENDTMFVRQVVVISLAHSQTSRL